MSFFPRVLLQKGENVLVRLTSPDVILEEAEHITGDSYIHRMVCPDQDMAIVFAFVDIGVEFFGEVGGVGF